MLQEIQQIIGSRLYNVLQIQLRDDFVDISKGPILGVPKTTPLVAPACKTLARWFLSKERHICLILGP